MADVKSVAVRLVADNALFKKAMRESGDDSMSMSKMTGVATAAAAAAVVAFGKKSIDTYVDTGKEVMKLSRISGENVEVASKMRYAAQMTGISTDGLAKGFKYLEKNMGANNAEFDKLGVNIHTAGGGLRSTHDVLLDTADAISHMTNATDRNNAASAIFGQRNGTELLPLLLKGKAGILALEQEAQKYGQVLTQDNVNAIKENITAHRHLDAAVSGLQMKFASQILPTVTAVTDAFSKLPGPIMDNIGPVTLLLGGLLAIAYIGPKVKAGFLAITEGGSMMGDSLSAAAMIAIPLILKGLDDIKNDSLKMQSDLSGSIDWTNSEKTREGLQKEGEAVQKLVDEYNKKGAVERALHVGEGKIANDARAQHEEDIAHYQAQTARVRDLGAALGISSGDAQQLTDSLHNVDLTKIAPSVYTPILQGLHDHTISAADATNQLAEAGRKEATSAEDAAAATKAQEDAVKGLNDTEKAALDPQFAMLKATQDLDKARKDAQVATYGYGAGSAEATAANIAAAQAQQNYNDAVKQHGYNSLEAASALQSLKKAQEDANIAANGYGPASQQAVTANMALAQAAEGSDIAVRNLEVAFETGKASVDQTKAALDGWVTSGAMTRKQADDISTALGLTKIKADDVAKTLDQQNTVKVDTTQANAALDALQAKIQDAMDTASKNGLGAIDIIKAGAKAAQQNVPAHASGGYLDPGWNLVGEQLGGGELVNRETGQVLTATQTRAKLTPVSQLSSGMGGQVHQHLHQHHNEITFPNYLGSKADVAREIHGELIQLEKSAAGTF